MHMHYCRQMSWWHFAVWFLCCLCMYSVQIMTILIFHICYKYSMVNDFVFWLNRAGNIGQTIWLLGNALLIIPNPAFANLCFASVSSRIRGHLVYVPVFWGLTTFSKPVKIIGVLSIVRLVFSLMQNKIKIK